MARDAFQASLSQGLNCAFSQFSLIGRARAKDKKEKETLILQLDWLKIYEQPLYYPC